MFMKYLKKVSLYSNQSKKPFFNLIFILFFILIFLSFSKAQQFSISGSVKDTEGRPLIGANIVLLETNRGAATNLNGEFEIKNLSPGSYAMEISMIGYRSEKIFDIRLVDKPLRFEIILEPTAVQTEQVIITANKYEQNISELPVSAEVIPLERIVRKNFTNLEDAMRYVPGVNMTSWQISIRGSSGYSRGAGTRVLLAFDGIPFYTGDTGEIIWGSLPITQIERVEVIKGASSSLYGSAAIGGVVNVITKSISEQPITYVKSAIGLWDKPHYSEWRWADNLRLFNNLALAHSRKIGELGIAAAFSRTEDMSYKQSGFYHRYVGFLKAEYDFSEDASAVLFLNTLNQRSGNFLYWKDSRNALIPPEQDQGQTVLTNRQMVGLLFKQIVNDKFFLNFRGSYYRSDWKDQTESANSALSDLFRGELQSNNLLTENLFLISGIESSFSNVSSNIFGKPSSFSIGIYSQAEYRFEFPLISTVGLRYDFTSINKSKSYSSVSPKLGLNYKINDKLILRSSAAFGFRAPTLAETFTSTTASGITIKPNPNLKPENNFTFEFGVNHKFNAQIVLDAAAFQNEFYDFIEPGVDRTDGQIFFNNIIRARIQGCEFGVKYKTLYEKVSLSLNYMYLWSKDLEKSKALKYRPKHSILFNADFLIYDFIFGIDFRSWSRVEEIDDELIDLGMVPEGELRVAVYVLDLRLAYNFQNFGFPLKMNLTANNIFNYNYVELIGNLAPIRNFSLGIELIL